MSEVPLLRLHLLRAAYLLIAAGLAATIWPGLLGGPSEWPVMNSVVTAMLASLSLIAALGLRYPLKMLPILLFELGWKAIWLVAVALPLWTRGELEGQAAQTAMDCLVGAILIPLIPWRYVVRTYFVAAGDRWRPDREAQ